MTCAESLSESATYDLLKKEERNIKDITTISSYALQTILEDHPYFSTLRQEEEFWNALLAAYPHQDMVSQIRKMTAWLAANPKKKRPDRKRFIQAWLAKEERKEKEHGKTHPEQYRTDRHDPEEKPAPFSDVPRKLLG